MTTLMLIILVLTVLIAGAITFGVIEDAKREREIKDNKKKEDENEDDIKIE